MMGDLNRRQQEMLEDLEGRTKKERPTRRPTPIKSGKNNMVPKARKVKGETIPEPPKETPQDLGQVLDEMTSIFRHGAFFEDQYAPEVATLMAASTHVFQEAASHNPIYLVTAETWGAGKSKHMIDYSNAVKNPEIITDPNKAQLYRIGSKLDKDKKPTFIVDEADEGLFGKDGVTALVNAAWVPETTKVLRSNTEQGKDFAQEPYSTWQPYAVGMIGKPPKPSTLSRCISVRLRKMDVAPLLDAGIVLDVGGVRKARARLRELGGLIRGLLMPHVEKLSLAAPKRPPEITDGRTTDNWRLLLAIADLAGGKWIDKARDAMVSLSSLARLADDDALDLLEIAKRRVDEGQEFVHTKALADEWIGQGRHIPYGDQEQWVAKQLGSLGLSTTRKRVKQKDGAKRQRRGYRGAAILKAHHALDKAEEKKEERKEAA